MAIRVTAKEVKDIVETTLVDSIVLNRMVSVASTIIDENLTGLTPAISTSTLRNIELYLSAHLVTLSEERGALTRSSLSDASETMANVYSAGLGSTRYGQVAMMLDTSGVLTSIGKTAMKAEFRII